MLFHPPHQLTFTQGKGRKSHVVLTGNGGVPHQSVWWRVTHKGQDCVIVNESLVPGEDDAVGQRGHKALHLCKQQFFVWAQHVGINLVKSFEKYAILNHFKTHQIWYTVEVVFCSNLHHEAMGGLHKGRKELFFSVFKKEGYVVLS